MNTIERNPMNSGEQLPENVDGLLRAFFAAERPEPWPVLKPPAEPTSPTRRPTLRRRTLIRSRGALAASLLILLAGPLYLSGRFADMTSPPADGGGITTAQGRGHSLIPKAAPAYSSNPKHQSESP
jgi:hypothetical protein